LEMVRSFEWGNALRLWKVKAAHKNTSILKEIKSFIKSVYAPRFIRIIKKLTGKSDYPWLTESWRKIAKDSLINFEKKSIRELSLTEIEYSSIPYQLHSEDRNSMLFSIESRLPFLDPRLVEYCIGLPSSYKIKNGYTKAVLRDAISELPESIRLRKNKMGFVAPDPIWVIQNKERVRQDLQNVIQASDIFSADLVNRFDRFVNGELGYEPIYFRAMAFNRFCKIFSLTIN
jgi:hypothetical protein